MVKTFLMNLLNCFQLLIFKAYNALNASDKTVISHNIKRDFRDIATSGKSN